jgi:hypothetical protein
LADSAMPQQPGVAEFYDWRKQITRELPEPLFEELGKRELPPLARL